MRTFYCALHSGTFCCALGAYCSWKAMSNCKCIFVSLLKFKRLKNQFPSPKFVQASLQATFLEFFIAFRFGCLTTQTTTLRLKSIRNIITNLVKHSQHKPKQPQPRRERTPTQHTMRIWQDSTYKQTCGFAVPTFNARKITSYIHPDLATTHPFAFFFSICNNN